MNGEVKDQKVNQGQKVIEDLLGGKVQRVQLVVPAKRVVMVFLVQKEGTEAMEIQVFKGYQDLMVLLEHQEKQEEMDCQDLRVQQDPKVWQAQQVHQDLLVRKVQQETQV